MLGLVPFLVLGLLVNKLGQPSFLLPPCSAQDTSTGFKPIQAKDYNNQGAVIENMYGDEEKETKEPKFLVGDLVRVPAFKTIFTKEMVGKYTREIFKVHEVNNTNPITYELEDLKGEVVQGGYYEQELQKVAKEALDEPFKIEKVLQKRKKGKKTEILVKYLGWPDKFNAWIDSKTVVDA